VNRAYLAFSSFGDAGEAFDVIVAEYEKVLDLFYQKICAKRGMTYEQRVEGDWIYITVTKSKAVSWSAVSAIGEMVGALAVRSGGRAQGREPRPGRPGQVEGEAGGWSQRSQSHEPRMTP